jgi:hypothetical protein
MLLSSNNSTIRLNSHELRGKMHKKELTLLIQKGCYLHTTMFCQLPVQLSNLYLI